MGLTQSEPLEGKAGYLLAALVTAIATGINVVMASHIAITNLVMVYLLGVAYVASRSSPGTAVLASFLSVAAFDFCFVPPAGTFDVHHVEYVFTFAVMLVVSLLISTLTVRLREQSNARNEAAVKVQVERMRGDLLSAVSHDLRTPLAAIEGSAGALVRQPGLSRQSRQLATTIQDESLRMARLIRNLLDMTRVQGAIHLDLDWYALDELMANAILLTEGMFQVPVRLSVAPDTPVAKVDGVLMEQVFVNLLENAAKHGGKGVHVTVEIGHRDDRLHVAVSDDGPGIDPASRERAFERFQGSGGAGFGLGLAICRAAVDAHQGRIAIDNRAEGGARVLIELPIEPETDDA